MKLTRKDELQSEAVSNSYDLPSAPFPLADRPIASDKQDNRRSRKGYPERKGKARVTTYLGNDVVTFLDAVILYIGGSTVDFVDSNEGVRYTVPTQCTSIQWSDLFVANSAES